MDVVKRAVPEAPCSDSSAEKFQLWLLLLGGANRLLILAPLTF